MKCIRLLYRYLFLRKALLMYILICALCLTVLPLLINSILPGFINAGLEVCYSSTRHKWFNSAVKNDDSITSVTEMPLLSNINTTLEPEFNFSRSVLIFTEYEKSRKMQKLKVILEANRIFYDIVTWNNLFDDDFLTLPRLVSLHSINYATFIFDNGQVYANMDSWNKEILHNYCKRFDLGIIVLSEATSSSKETDWLKLSDLPVWVKYGTTDLYNTELNPKSTLLQIAKPGGVLEENLPESKHSVFFSNESSYEAVAYSFREEDTIYETLNFQKSDAATSSYTMPYEARKSKYISVMYDTGKHDGIKRVFFGARVDNYWMYRLLFLDALSVSSNGVLNNTDLHRWILIDIDDIFVAHKGTRMKKEDVEVLIQTQEEIATDVPGFRFNLGFSGFYFQNGTPEENEGDSLLIKNAEKFWWFCHMYRHQKPHVLKSVHHLKQQMRLNKEFALKHNISVDSTYSVAPHHSGVYPVHEQLYEAWKSVWNIQATSTEEYPHLHPSWQRRGFIFKNIMVLPRQTCGLFTKTLFFDTYPKGRQRLEKSIHGGELFMTIIDNPVSVFMTHFGNYGSDRLAIYTFKSVIKFLKKWTNLKLRTERPVELAKKYFDIFKDDAEPVWGNPCKDPRHLSIWSARKSCARLPNFVIIGPQKTGTTALHVFLSMHPNLIGNQRSSSSYEEVQFFNKDNYLKGMDWNQLGTVSAFVMISMPWSNQRAHQVISEKLLSKEFHCRTTDRKYMDFFPEAKNETGLTYFEKSANYFDSNRAQPRVFALLPDAKLIMILIDPAKRAYSWYQGELEHLTRVLLFENEDYFVTIIRDIVWRHNT